MVSDRRDTIPEAIVRGTIRATDAAGEIIDTHVREWTGVIPADECVLIGRVTWVIPSGATELTVDLELTSDAVTVTNRYHAPVR